MRWGGCPQSRHLCLLETSLAAQQEGAGQASEEADAESTGREGQAQGQHMLRVTDARQPEQTGPQRWGASAMAHDGEAESSESEGLSQGTLGTNRAVSERSLPTPPAQRAARWPQAGPRRRCPGWQLRLGPN